MYQRRMAHLRSSHVTIGHGISTMQMWKLLKWMQNQRMTSKYLRRKFLHSSLTKARHPLLLLPPLLIPSPFLSFSTHFSPPSHLLFSFLLSLPLYLLFSLLFFFPLLLPPLIPYPSFIPSAFPPSLTFHFYFQTPELSMSAAEKQRASVREKEKGNEVCSQLNCGMHVTCM